VNLSRLELLLWRTEERDKVEDSRRQHERWSVERVLGAGESLLGLRIVSWLRCLGWCRPCSLMLGACGTE